MEEKNKKKSTSNFKGKVRGKDGRSQRSYSGRGYDSTSQGDSKLTEQQVQEEEASIELETLALVGEEGATIREEVPIFPS